MTLATFIQASAHRLDGIADGSVQAIVCSPPYYGLRAYQGDQNVEWPTVEYAPMPGLPPIRIAGCEPGREHEWQDGPARKVSNNNGLQGSTLTSGAGPEKRQAWHDGKSGSSTGAYCALCGGWRGGLGNEPTLEAYIGHLILCLREWRRVLRDDGICFVNLGDSYASDTKSDNRTPSERSKSSTLGPKRDGLGGGNAAHIAASFGALRVNTGLASKQLCMVPARFALAAQADGWWLRSDIIGHKIAPMPESVTDRPTRSHEHIFMLTKQSRYFWDGEAVRDPLATAIHKPGNNFHPDQVTGPNDRGGHSQWEDTKIREWGNPAGRNMRDVIEWRPSPFPGAHFAVWPEAIPEKLIRAATSERGCCPACGTPWRRVVERTKAEYKPCNGAYSEQHIQQSKGKTRSQAGGMPIDGVVTVGWEPSCACPPHEPVPCIVLDPFSGSGTTAKVAVRLGRRAIGVDIASEYLDEVTAQRFGAGVQMELVSA